MIFIATTGSSKPKGGVNLTPKMQRRADARSRRWVQRRRAELGEQLAENEFTLPDGTLVSLPEAEERLYLLYGGTMPQSALRRRLELQRQAFLTHRDVVAQFKAGTNAIALARSYKRSPHAIRSWVSGKNYPQWFVSPTHFSNAQKNRSFVDVAGIKRSPERQADVGYLLGASDTLRLFSGSKSRSTQHTIVKDPGLASELSRVATGLLGTSPRINQPTARTPYYGIDFTSRYFSQFYNQRTGNGTRIPENLLGRPGRPKGREARIGYLRAVADAAGWVGKQGKYDAMVITLKNRPHVLSYTARILNEFDIEHRIQRKSHRIYIYAKDFARFRDKVGFRSSDSASKLDAAIAARAARIEPLEDQLVSRQNALLKLAERGGNFHSISSLVREMNSQLLEQHRFNPSDTITVARMIRQHHLTRSFPNLPIRRLRGRPSGGGELGFASRTAARLGRVFELAAAEPSTKVELGRMLASEHQIFSAPATVSKDVSTLRKHTTDPGMLRILRNLDQSPRGRPRQAISGSNVAVGTGTRISRNPSFQGFISQLPALLQQRRTQAEMATMFGVTQPTISNWMRRSRSAPSSQQNVSGSLPDYVI